MDIRIKKALDKDVLRFGKYLPRYFKSNLLGAWVSPRYINFPNRLYKGDANTLRGRLRTTSKENSLAELAKTAFKEKWFNWRLINVGQSSRYEKIQDIDNYKILLIKLNIDIFKGEGAYRRFLTIASIIEYYTHLYGMRVKVVFVILNNKLRSKNKIFSKYSSIFKSYYTTTKTVGLLGALTLLNRIYKLSKGR